MKNKYLFVTILLLAMALLGYGFTRGYIELEEQEDEEELLIVTSFYPMYVAALNVAGDCEGVRVENLSEPQTGCLHDYQLTPQDMILLSQADIFVVNGGGIEAFLTDVVREYPDLIIINAGAEIFGEDTDSHASEESHEEAGSHIAEESQEEAHAGHDHGENAHAWMSIGHYMEQITAIRNGLSKADPSRTAFYEKGAAEYLEKISALKQEAAGLTEAAGGTSIVVFHEAFEFVAEDYGMQLAGELNLDEERQVSAGEIADIIKVIQEKNIQILLAEDLYGKGMGDTIEKETDCKVYYLDTLVRGDGSKDSWLVGMEQNIQILKTALGVEDSLCVK